MAFSNMLSTAGHSPREIRTTARLTLAKTETGFKISKIRLETSGVVEGIDDATFQTTAEKAKEGCPVSQLLKPGLEEMTLKATLKK
jgi:osmotically inducible protein OsmC